MKPTSAFIVFAMLMASAVAAGIDSLLHTQRLAETDVEHALAMTLVSCDAYRIDADTIRTYRHHITLDYLRDTAYIAMSVADDTDRRPTLTAHTGLTPLLLWQQSDQRASGMLTMLAALWLAISLWTTAGAAHTAATHHTAETAGTGIQADTEAANTTPDTEAATLIAALRLTPMQRQLLEMFLAAPDHRVSQQDICDRLWPKKPDASATLYTLIRRTKPTLAQAGLRIECERGQAYRLAT